jgi:hypothetical protein
MIYELRTYWAAPGKIEALHDRFRFLTLDIFKRLNMEVVGFWTPALATGESGDLIYMLGFADKAAKEAAWDIFEKDPAWIEGKAKTEINGQLVQKVTSVLLDATDYSPMK